MAGRVKNKNLLEDMDKMTVFWSACGLVFIAVFLISFYASKPSVHEVRLTIDFGDGNARNFVTDYREGITAWDMLQQANAVYGVPLTLENHFAPRTIGDKENGEDGKRWNFYLNGQKASEPHESVLPGGARVIFKFE